MTQGLLASLTEDEEVTLRRVAYGQSEVRSLRRHDLTRLYQMRLIEDSEEGPRLTADGKLRFDVLPKAELLGSSEQVENARTAQGRKARTLRR
jgi:hypothetical protein